jgi:anti-sigma B factor antagonist
MASRRLQIAQVGDVTVVRFADCRVLDEASAHLIGQELFDLVEKDGHRKILLNLAEVNFLASTALGKLVVLHKKLRVAGGEVKLCSLQEPIRDVFAITKLDTVFDIREDEPAGLLAFAKR